MNYAPLLEQDSHGFAITRTFIDTLNNDLALESNIDDLCTFQ